MDTATLKQVLLEEMQKYAGEGFNVHGTLTVNEQEQFYAIIDVAKIRGKRFVGAVLVAHIATNAIVIDLDMNDRLLVDALKAQGVPESQIVLAYQEDMQLA